MADKPRLPASRPPTAAEQREKRLAEALRANLKRRKAAASGPKPDLKDE